MKTESLKKVYQSRLSLIEKELEKILPEQVQSDWIQFNGGMDLSHLDPHLATAFTLPARNLVFRGGKRWRPMLLLLAAELASGHDFDQQSDSDLLQQALMLSPLVELPHNGSLIVDDIEDHSDFRRGEPAVHLIHGEDISINAGNLIYFLPTSILEQSNLPLEKQALLYQIYTRCLRRLHIGQGMDIYWHNHPDFFPTQEAYETMCRLKTGSLARMATEIGTTLAEGEASQSALLSDLAEKIGLAFQIIDDITNLRTGNPGKKRGDDIVERKKSLPVILFAQKNDPTQLIQYMNEANKKGIEEANSAVEAAISLITQSGALGEAENYAQNLIDTSLKQLNSAYSPSTALELLNWMFNGFKLK